MSTYDNLSVYRASYDLLVELFRFTKNFSREYKFTLGENIKKETVEMITNIYRANSSFLGRKEKIQSARENVETIRLFLRLLKDLRQVDLKKFVFLNEKIESVSRQLTGWEKKSWKKAGVTRYQGTRKRADASPIILWLHILQNIQESGIEARKRSIFLISLFTVVWFFYSIKTRIFLYVINIGIYVLKMLLLLFRTSFALCAEV